jgi:hypothetical protein
VNAQAIADETNRATLAEGVNAQAIADETNRATAAEEANAADISTNATNIATNDADISTNATNIATNDADISTNAAAIEELAGLANTVEATVIDEETGETATYVFQTNSNGDIVTDENGEAVVIGKALGEGESGIVGVVTKRNDGYIHIGKNSFLFDETPGAHRLTTNDGTLILGGMAIDPTTGVIHNVTEVEVDADLVVNGDVFINGNAGVQAQLDANAAGIAKNKKDIQRNARGIAMVAALQHTTVLPGMNNALDISAAHFEGETGMSLNYARRINENVQINFGAASTTDFDESVIKAGVGVQW